MHAPVPAVERPQPPGRVVGRLRRHRRVSAGPLARDLHVVVLVDASLAAPGQEDGKLGEPARRLPAQRDVRLVVPVRRQPLEEPDVQVEEERHDHDRRDDHARRDLRDGERGERGDAQDGDRHQPLGDAREPERGEVRARASSRAAGSSPARAGRGRRRRSRARRRARTAASRSGRARPASASSGKSQPRNTKLSRPVRTCRVIRSRPDAEYCSTSARLRPPPVIEPGNRQRRDERPRADAGDARGEPRDSARGPVSARRRRRAGRTAPRPAPGGRRRTESRRARPPPARPTSGFPSATARMRSSARGQQDRDRPAEMSRALRDPVRPEREREPADERRTAAQPELPQPCEREQPRRRRTRSRISRFHAITGPNAASAGQYGSPNGQPPKLSRGLASGWNEYGSIHGALPFSSWWPTSQRW